MSLAVKPASRKRLAMASAATVVLPTESVVLISTSCLYMSCASCFVASFVCARAPAPAATRLSTIAASLMARSFIPSPDVKPEKTIKRGNLLPLALHWSKRRRRKGPGGRGLEAEDGVKIDLKPHVLPEHSLVKNVRKSFVDFAQFILRQRVQKLTEVIFCFSYIPGILGSCRKNVIMRKMFYVIPVERIAELFFVERRIGLFHRICRRICGSDRFHHKLIERLLEIAKFPRAPISGPLPLFPSDA